MNWRPMGVNRQAQTYEMENAPRYQVRAEWVHCGDHVNRIRYRAFFSGCVIAGIAPSADRSGIVAELDNYIKEVQANADPVVCPARPGAEPAN